MSAFLGPIHHWVFSKILLQDQIVDRLIEFAAGRGLDLAPILAARYGEMEKRPLEEMIDPHNIHGWLQERVSVVEYRLAAAVQQILSETDAQEEDLAALFTEIGRSLRLDGASSAANVFKALGDRLLDGMPCDRANEVISESADEVTWRRVTCVHSPYWAEIGADVRLYDVLRGRLIDGMLDGTGFCLENRADNGYAIVKRTI